MGKRKYPAMTGAQRDYRLGYSKSDCNKSMLIEGIRAECAARGMLNKVSDGEAWVKMIEDVVEKYWFHFYPAPLHVSTLPH
jgi:hypothetical protein